MVKTSCDISFRIRVHERKRMRALIDNYVVIFNYSCQDTETQVGNIVYVHQYCTAQLG